MISESHPNDSPEDDLRLPPEILRALAKIQPEPATVPPEIDAAILRAAKTQLSSARPSNIHWFFLAIAAAACILLYFGLHQPNSNENPQPPRDPIAKQEDDAAMIILREFSALYPNQVNAIIQDSNGIQVTLEDQPHVAQRQALVLKVCQAGECEEIITFIGQKIDVAGHQVTVRTEINGRVILDGDQFLWTSDFQENPAPGIHIESRRL